jgi:hypothetical protein
MRAINSRLAIEPEYFPVPGRPEQTVAAYVVYETRRGVSCARDKRRKRMTSLMRTKRFSIVGLLGGTAMVLALTAAPVGLGVDDGQIMIKSATAVAKGGNGGGNSNGGGNGGGNGKSAKGTSFDDSGNGPGNGKAKKAAKARYDAAFGKARGPKHADDGDETDVGTEEATLTDDAAEALVKNGWGTKSYDQEYFSNHGDMVSTYVAIAKELGYGGYVGSMQANFGSPYLDGEETVDPALLVVLEVEVQTDGEEVGDGEADGTETTEETEGKVDWQTVNLDVNLDGEITKDDLAMARGETTSDGSEGGGTTGTTDGTDEGDGTEDGAVILADGEAEGDGTGAD